VLPSSAGSSKSGARSPTFILRVYAVALDSDRTDGATTWSLTLPASVGVEHWAEKFR
jgi:hypothetical protein